MAGSAASVDLHMSDHRSSNNKNRGLAREEYPQQPTGMDCSRGMLQLGGGYTLRGSAVSRR